MNFDLFNALSHLEKPDGVIAFPTDTVYGVGCRIDKPDAIQRIYRIKNRNEGKPLILLGCEPRCFEPYVQSIPDKARKLMDNYWPGALTIILPKSDALSSDVTRGMETVGLRVPACRTLMELLGMLPQGLLATTSANRSGDPPALTAVGALNAFGDDVDFVLADDLAIQDKVASTVVAFEPDGSLQVLRTGSIVLD